MTADAFSLSVPIRDVPAGGRHYRVEAGAEERRLLAEALGILDVRELAADLRVRRLHGAIFEVRGALRAKVVQTDVVTLDPVEQEVEEEIGLALAPSDADVERAQESTDADEAGPLDSYRDGRIDLGKIVAEHLALGLDPYPRGGGVDFEDRLEDEGPEASPFAALSVLRDKGA